VSTIEISAYQGGDSPTLVAAMKTTNYLVREWLDCSHPEKHLNHATDSIGNSVIISAENIGSVLQAELDQYADPEEVTLVGHAIQNEHDFLNKAGVSASDHLFPYAIDTQHAFMHLLGHYRVSPIDTTVEKLGIEVPGALHNSGCDTSVTLQSLFVMSIDYWTKFGAGRDDILCQYSTIVLAFFVIMCAVLSVFLYD
jgi:hypothetical protein